MEAQVFHGRNNRCHAGGREAPALGRRRRDRRGCAGVPLGNGPSVPLERTSHFGLLSSALVLGRLTFTSSAVPSLFPQFCRRRLIQTWLRVRFGFNMFRFLFWASFKCLFVSSVHTSNSAAENFILHFFCCSSTLNMVETVRAPYLYLYIFVVTRAVRLSK